MSTETTNTTVTEFEDGSKIVETTTTESEYVEGEGGEIEMISEAVAEPVTEAAVQIAQIEAERDITIAAIQADVTTTAIEAEAEEQDESEWRQNIENRLAETNSRLEQVTEMLSTLGRSEQAEANLPENPEPASADPTPVNPEAEADQSAPEPPKRAKKSRWI